MEEHKIKHIVISGGGVTGLSFYGILRETHRNKLWCLENIKTIYCTSIGTFLAVVICLGYEWEILDTYFIKRPWQNLFKFDLYSFLNVFEKKGIFDIKIFEEMIGPLFSGMNIPMNITMEEFYKKTGIEIHMFSTDLNSMSYVDISYKTHPKWTVIQSIYCSSIIPIVFEPYICNENILSEKKDVEMTENQSINSTELDIQECNEGISENPPVSSVSIACPGHSNPRLPGLSTTCGALSEACPSWSTILQNIAETNEIISTPIDDSMVTLSENNLQESVVGTENKKICYIDGGFFMNYPLNKCIIDTCAHIDEVLGLNKLQNTSTIPIIKESTFFDYIMVAFNSVFEIVLKKYQGPNTIKITHEYTIIDSAITLQSIIDTACSMEERVRLIQKGAMMC
jgi:hypothetical protein